MVGGDSKTVSTDGKLNISKVVNITIPVETAAMPEQYIDYRLYSTQAVKDGFSLSTLPLIWMWLFWADVRLN